jgi:hypothetical protein
LPEPSDGEEHTVTSHVWWRTSPLELIFQFDKGYYLTEVLFWNYFGEQFDVDQIELKFFTSDSVVEGNLTVFPILGRNSDGINNNDIIAERLRLNVNKDPVTTVSAVVTSTNGEIDFQNFVFLGVEAI